MKIKMTIGNNEYLSTNDWESLEAFHAASAAGEIGGFEFGAGVESDAGLDAVYTEA